MMIHGKDLIDIEDTEIKDDQVLITGITWDKRSAAYHARKVTTNVEELPTQFTLNIPENILKQAKSSKASYKDTIESFVYNFLTHKYGYEVCSCSIWLPMTED